MRSLFITNEKSFVQSLSRLAYCNPFLPERITLEREALGEMFVEGALVWSMSPTLADQSRANIFALRHRVRELAVTVHARLGADSDARWSPSDLSLYEDLVLYLLYTQVWEEMQTLIERPALSLKRVAAYDGFLRDFRHFFPKDHPSARRGPSQPEVIFAGFFQIRRAFHFAFSNIIGSSLSAARLRAAIWESIFTHDMRRYQRVLVDRMGDFTTLITGPSGTGKEIVARAIALSRYIPFDAARGRWCFAEDFSQLFHPLNLSALPSTLIESELFGHRRGAFTGAIEDRKGWLETCQPLGTVFLDEIGDLDPVIQVKLLRVLQSRTFQRLGDADDRRFAGKIIAATNRDLSSLIADGQFRSDFYYRLCSDIITTPSLREQLATDSSGEELHNLILFIAQRVAGDEAEGLTDEVHEWIVKHLGRDYAWPGNFRELEQCVRNVLIRREYRPPQPASTTERRNNLADALFAGKLTADELLREYCRHVFAQTNSYVETARRLQLDRRTVKSKVALRPLA